MGQLRNAYSPVPYRSRFSQPRSPSRAHATKRNRRARKHAPPLFLLLYRNRARLQTTILAGLSVTAVLNRFGDKSVSRQNYGCSPRHVSFSPNQARPTLRVIVLSRLLREPRSTQVSSACNLGVTYDVCFFFMM